MNAATEREAGMALEMSNRLVDLGRDWYVILSVEPGGDWRLTLTRDRKDGS